jgi:hypothetical protein
MSRVAGPPPAGAADAARVGHRVAQHRYGVLLAALLLLFGVQGVASATPFQQFAVTVLAAASVLLAFHAARLRPAAVHVATAVALVAIGFSFFRWTVGGIGEGVALVMDAALVALGPPVVAVGVLRSIRTSGQVHLESVMGVLALYLLLGMLFAFVYGAIDRFGGDPVFANGTEATASLCLYFSFTTLTTVGYGDVVTRSDLGHTLAVLEALLGQIYLVTVVSVLVSNLGRRARGRPSGSTGTGLNG